MLGNNSNFDEKSLSTNPISVTGQHSSLSHYQPLPDYQSDSMTHLNPPDEIDIFNSRLLEGLKGISSNAVIEEMDEYQVSPEDAKKIIEQSKLSDPNDKIQIKKIITEFNKDLKENLLVKSSVRGFTIQPSKTQFLLVHKNNAIELATADDSGLFLAAPFFNWPNPVEVVPNKCIFATSEPYFNYGNKHYIYVKDGKYALGWSGHKSKPRIFGPGPHVVHDNTGFTLEVSNNNYMFVNQNTPRINIGNLHILNVPTGQYAKVFLGPNRTPKLLPSRQDPYIYNTQYFSCSHDNKELFVNINEAHIKHGNINILNVPQGYYAQIQLGPNKLPLILKSKKEPYVFNTPYFHYQTDKLWVPTNEPYIQYGSWHILQIPKGMRAKILRGTQAELLDHRPTPHIINDVNFKLIKSNNGSNFIDAWSPVIHHGTKYIIRVPQGMVCKAWYGNKPLLLEAKNSFTDANSISINESNDNHANIPFTVAENGNYEIDDLLFRLEDESNPFTNATDPLIIHGSIKSILPGINSVAITNDNGIMKVLQPDKDGKPIKITSSTHKFEYFLDTSIQNLNFPSEDVIRKKLINGVKDEEAKYEVFTTQDFCKIGVSLFVAFKIKDPEKAVRQLKTEKDILQHIENITQADMRKVMAQCNSQSFTNADTTRPRYIEQRDEKNGKGLLPPSAPFRYIQDETQAALARDLDDCGIELIRLNVVESKMLDKERVEKAQKLSMDAAVIYAREATLENTTRVEKAEAERKATVAKVEQDQKNATIKSIALAQKEAAETKAQADFSQQKAIADAQLYQAQRKNDAALLEYEMQKRTAELNLHVQSETKKIEIETERRKLELQVEAEIKKVKALAEACTNNPEYARYLSAQVCAERMNKTQMTVYVAAKPEDMAGNIHGFTNTSTFVNPYSMFNSNLRSLPENRDQKALALSSGNNHDLPRLSS